MKDAPFIDIPLDRAVALVRACQKLNCDTAEQLFTMVERRCAEARALRDALEMIAGRRQCLDNLMSNVAIAEAALAGTR